jgi:iron complex outermembrane receptor protein
MELAFALRYDREERDVQQPVPNVSNSGLNVNLLGSGHRCAPADQSGLRQ